LRPGEHHRFTEGERKDVADTIGHVCFSTLIVLDPNQPRIRKRRVQQRLIARRSAGPTVSE
jgi:hypothetical protein